ncbi:MAG TPA: bifunctional UDP-N-acetylglucosamine diphosphorylase/glucosamine-1-phosphate N-acetyltransferase GlmU [Chloroflexota bacterium]|nr:bifunctional UDP-N-acetylglucosamine diphosphorylase/glucosamine-1-phosphate N-acetyltransferase GlmU [Chloroflexota bacterium]
MTPSPLASTAAAIVLAAGKGTRMKSARHKVLHRVAGRTMLWHVLTALRDAGIPVERTCIVVGDGAEQVRSEVQEEHAGVPYAFVLQERQGGTGHAVLAARAAVPTDAATTVVAYADAPLLQASTIQRLLAQHEADDAAGHPVTLVTGTLEDPQDLGRIVRGADRTVREIVEQRDATSEQRAIREVNSGFCAFRTSWMWDELPRVQPARNGEIYLTALTEQAVRAGLGVGALVIDEITDAIGVNTRAQLAEAEAVMRGRIARRLMSDGVTLQDPATTYVDAGVSVGPDSVVYANTHLRGRTVIGRDCEIGPNALVRDSAVADRCRIVASVLDGADLEEDVSVGPFAHLRPGTRCGRAVQVGTGSEIKGSTLGAGSRMHHFGYLGDATVGADVNVGAGAVTCNFDGALKHATRIGDGAFIGSGTLLVAPVEVGAGALTGAGAVVTKDVAQGERVAGVPARPLARGTTDRQTARKDREDGDDARPTA